MDRTTEERRRLERQLVTLRWLVAAIGAAQVMYAVRSGGRDPALAVPLGAAIVVALVAGNMLFSRAVDQATDAGRLALLGTISFVVDAAAITLLIGLATDGPDDPVWVLGYLLALEGAARWGLLGGLMGAAIFIGGQVGQELYLRETDPALAPSWAVLAFRGGMAIVIGAVAGSFATSLGRAVGEAHDRAREAEEAADRAEAAAERERQARREVALLHATVLDEPEAGDIGAHVRATAEAIGRELGCDALGVLLRSTGAAGEVRYEAMGVFGDPGYLEGMLLAPASHPVAAAAEDRIPIHAGPDLVAPMLARGEIVGAIHERTLDAAGPAQPEERLLVLARLGDQLGLVIESARLRAAQEATVTRLRELDQMKSDFVAVTSHELRTPLAGIRGFVDMIRRRGGELTPEETREYLDIVMTQTDRLIQLVDDLLVVAKVEAGKLALEPEPFEIPAFLDAFVKTFGDDAARIRTVRGADAPEAMVADPRRLTQILVNLVHNALKFSPEDASVELSWAAPADGTVHFAVSDRGPGMTPEELGKVFDRFHQVEHANSHSEGFGLGLYITRQLSEAMGGWVEATSEAGTGATFTVTLPLDRPLGAPARPARAAPADRTAS
jgi:signal transduction histidine kinase